MPYFGKTSYKDLVFARNKFLRLVRAPNVFLILIIILYVQFLSWDQNNFARVTLEQKKKYFKGYNSAKLVIRT